MICPACGAANEDGVLFCEKCKADLEMPAPTPSPQVAAMNEPAAPAEEPIALEPIALEPVGEVPPPAGFEPAGAAPEPPVVLEPVIESPADDAPAPEPASKPKTAVPPPLPATPPVVPTAPKLVVVRGQRMDVSYPLYPGKNFLGRTDDKPVDIDLEDQESTDRIWTSRQHAVVTFEDGKLTVEDLNSLNGTFVNRTRVHPGQVRELGENDVLQVGTVHLKVVFG